MHAQCRFLCVCVVCAPTQMCDSTQTQIPMHWCLETCIHSIGVRCFLLTNGTWKTTTHYIVSLLRCITAWNQQFAAIRWTFLFVHRWMFLFLDIFYVSLGTIASCHRCSLTSLSLVCVVVSFFLSLILFSLSVCECLSNKKCLPFYSVYRLWWNQSHIELQNPHFFLLVLRVRIK